MKVESTRGLDFSRTGIGMLDYTPREIKAIRQAAKRPRQRTPEQWMAWRQERRAASFKRFLDAHYESEGRRLAGVGRHDRLNDNDQFNAANPSTKERT